MPSIPIIQKTTIYHHVIVLFVYFLFAVSFFIMIKLNHIWSFCAASDEEKRMELLTAESPLSWLTADVEHFFRKNILHYHSYVHKHHRDLYTFVKPFSLFSRLGFISEIRLPVKKKKTKLHFAENRTCYNN